MGTDFEFDHLSLKNKEEKTTQPIYLMMPLAGHWIGIKPPRESLSSLLSFCSTGKGKLYLPDIPAIRVPA